MKNLTLFLTALMLIAFSAQAQFSGVGSTPNQQKVGIRIVRSDSTSTYINPIKYKKIKSSGGFAAALTMGIAKIKVNVKYNGSSSDNKAAVGDKFLFTFGDVPTDAILSHYMFSKMYSLRNFSLCKFKVGKKMRELTTAEVSTWTGMDYGSTESDAIKFDVKCEQDGVYEVTILEAIPGEYCFMFSDHAAGAFQYVYDFSIE